MTTVIGCEGSGHRVRRVAEHGQATMLALAVAVLAVATLAGLTRLGTDLVLAARAEAAADAAALAAALGGRARGDAVATDNGAVVVAARIEPGWAQLTVVRHGHRATATAALVAAVAPGVGER